MENFNTLSIIVLEEKLDNIILLKVYLQYITYVVITEIKNTVGMMMEWFVRYAKNAESHQDYGHQTQIL